MIKTILGTKSNMSSVFNQFGHQVPVTTVIVKPNIVVGLQGQKVILGTGKKKKTKKTETAISKIVGHSPRFIKEVMLENITSEEQKPQEIPQENSQQNQETNLTDSKVKIGDKVTVSIFEAGDEVKVTGTTKGKGFAGVVKRWGFAGGPKTHGQSDRHRAPGSIGAGTTPGRVFKGKKMAGHMGSAKLTVTGLEIIEVNEGKNLLLIKGAIPGARDGFLIIKKTGKIKGYTPPSEEKQAAAKGPLREASEPRPKGQKKEAKEDAKEENKYGDKIQAEQNADVKDQKSAENQESKSKEEVKKENKGAENAKS